VRVQALQDVPALLCRQPGTTRGRRMMAADPDTGVAGLKRLPDALRGAQDLAGFLKTMRLPLEAEFGPDATSASIVDALRDPDLSLFIFSGHGDEDSLFLAGRERVSSADLDVRWRRAPFIHLDCCLAGAHSGLGGGRFVGLPIQLLECGASAVLASSHLLFEKPAAEFSREFYSALLNDGATAGQALLSARRLIHRQYGGNPFLWATSALWGNPAIRLVENECVRFRERLECTLSSAEKYPRRSLETKEIL
jgi:CHAT domain-containing protein